jgi:hypothetical protein
MHPYRSSFGRFTVLTLSLVWAVRTVNAQGPQTAVPGPGKDVDIMLMLHGDGAGVPFDTQLPPGGMDMAFMTAPLGLAGETVTGAPYSAEAVSEVVQTLGDGNRIVHESRTSLYRDTAGRTRREQGLAVVGPLVGVGAMGTQIQISDPVGEVSYVLDMERHEAIKMPLPKIQVASTSGGGSAASFNQTFELPVPPPPAGGAGTVFFRRSASVSVAGTPVVEQLGPQVLEGVEAQGTRSTLTIPADAIGNERPVVVVSERWYSPELKALVLSRQSDPRYGETTYRLTNIIRSEPSADLFEVPADFTIVEGPAHGPKVIMRMEHKQ